MKFHKIIFWMFGLAVLAVGCTADQPINDFDNDPTSEYVRLNLFSGNDNDATTGSAATRAVWDDSKGSGNLIFKWESVDIDSDKTNSLSFILSNGKDPILGRTTSQNYASEISYSGLAVTPHKGDSHRATFQTVNYYNANDLKSAAYCYAVGGGATINDDIANSAHLCHLEMPATFAQDVSQDTSFLRDYMYMYATATYNVDGTLLRFNHIPATFRFVITNSKDNSISLQEVSISVSDGSAVASKTADIKFGWASKDTKLTFGESGHNRISVVTGRNTSLAKGAKYTAYAMAMPLPSNNSFKGKTLNFSITSDGQEQIVYQLEGAKLAELNGHDRYNWASGKSYTIRINIVEEGEVLGDILAENRIEVTPNASGTYTLVYEDANGLPLADYAEICTLSVNELAYYEDFIDVNIAPRDAKVIGIYDSTNERQGIVPLNNFKPDFSKAPMYSFGLLSDVHIGRSVINPESDFERALKLFNSKNVAHTCICGDITQNGKEAELNGYKNILPVANAPVYTVTGNHDATTSGLNLDLWTQYIDLPLVFEKTVEIDGKKDHFLFLGMNIWNFASPYLDEHLDWLEEKLEAYRNERCFIITHLFFPERAGNLNDIYPSGNWLRGAQLELLEGLCDRYVNSIWFSGHSHWEWQLQKYQDRANIYRTHNAALQPTSGWCVHIPSCGVPITSDGTTRVDNTEGSEGAVIEVYEDHIDILGIDLKNGKYLPIATYRLDTTIQDVAAKPAPDTGDYIKASDFIINQGKAGATVKDIEDMPNYVEVTFTDKGQGFYVANSSYTTSATGVTITVEDMQAFSNGVSIDIPANVGFYGSSGYYLTSTNKAEVKPDTYTGVQFQTSKSKYGDGPLPLTLRMKVKMKFY